MLESAMKQNTDQVVNISSPSVCETTPLLRPQNTEHTEVESGKTSGKSWERVGRSVLVGRLILETAVANGILAGLITTVIWWLDLNLSSYCFGKAWGDIPPRFQRMHLITDVAEAIFIQFWSLASLAPLLSWASIVDMALPHWCAISAGFDAISRISLFVFGLYGDGWCTIVGNVIFFSNIFLMHSKVAKVYMKRPGGNLRIVCMAAKLSTQFIIGMAVALMFNNIFPKLYVSATASVKTVLGSILPIFFAIPRFIANIIIGNLTEFECLKRQAALVICLQVATTLIARMVQASNESFVSFVVISVAHGALNVVDKLVLPLRNKITKLILRREANNSREFLAGQALIGMVTETTAVVLSCSSVYITMYYFMKDDTNGQRFDGNDLFYRAITRICVAILIQVVFDIITVKIQADMYGIPIMAEWKLHWKFFVAAHMIQIVLSMMYFSEYIDRSTMPHRLQALNNSCIIPFSRLSTVTE